MALYRRILALKDLPVIRNNLGHALAELGMFEPAIAEYRSAVELKPDYAEAVCNWGVALSNLERLDEAEAKFRRAAAINPGFAGGYHNLAVILKERGRLDEAIRAAKRAIDLAPRNASYYEHLAGIGQFEPGDRYIEAMEKLARDAASLGAMERIHLHFALARGYEDTGRFDAAFAQLQAGNALRRRHVAYDEAATLGRMDRTREVFSAEFLAARRDAGEPSALPIFIVGMPRSGTTLIEQILASHARVFGAGEINLLDIAAGTLGKALPGAPPFPEMASAMSADDFRRLGASYLERLRQRAPDASRIVDKMPGNFFFAGLIHLALPNATIIHAVRDPLDTCVSCFSILFVNQPQTHDLAGLGRYYRHYRELMAHWRRVLPPQRLLDVHYEELVGDLEGVARRIVTHCGLPWDARCLDFHSTARTVRTASATQVRRPIYRTSVGRWRRYEKFLQPLIAELDGNRAASPIDSQSRQLTEEPHA